MTVKLLFALYAGAIPLVPLMGAEEYKKRQDRKRRLICLSIFAVQLLLSAVSIATYCFE